MAFVESRRIAPARVGPVRLAKSKSAGGASPPTVAQHGHDVLRAFRLIWKSVGHELAGALGTDAAILEKRVFPLAELGALLHDFGKLNSAFQAMLQNHSGKRQPVRHEILSAIAITDPELAGNWFSQSLGEENCWLLAWAVAGHHLQIEGGKTLWTIDNTDRQIELFFGDPQAAALLAEARKILEPRGGSALAAPPELEDLMFSVLDGDPRPIAAPVRRFCRESQQRWRHLRQDSMVKRDLSCVKALVVSADVAGSAVAANGIPMETWLPKALGRRVGPRDLEGVIRDGLKGHPAREFQRAVGYSESPATVVVAGCGNGKTTAAYMWATKRALGRKLFFTYPTTGTASAGFEDYLLQHPGLKRTLLHGRSTVDLAAMEFSPEDEHEDLARIESLEAWGRQVIACTADTVLGIIQNQRRPLFSFPAIMSGAFVFDEVHSYDRRLFGALLRFLELFPGVPVLLMSASIPPARLERLKAVLAHRLGDVIRGDPDLETRRRYLLERVASADDALESLLSVLRHSTPEKNAKVLWVCNTVRDALETWRKLRGLQAEGQLPGELRILPYHSRYRYRDRVERQREVLGLFRRKRPCLVVSTQVCEMSLDISAGFLVSALAPLPALVQRLGRLNRYATTDDPRTCLIYPFQGKPYEDEESRSQLQAAVDAIGRLEKMHIGQVDLAAELDAMTGEEVEFPESSAWLDGGWESHPLPLRQASSTMTVIREDDLDEIETIVGSRSQGRWTSQRLVPWTIPMPVRQSLGLAPRAGPYPVAPLGTVRYDAMEGASWAK